MSEPTVRSATLPLLVTYAVVPLAAGADKFVNLLADWDQYIAPAVQKLLPFSGETFMMIVGVIEIAAGVLMLTRFRRLAAYVVSAWLALIAVNLLMGGWLDVAVRDLAMSVGAFALGQLLGVAGEAVIPGAADRHRAAAVTGVRTVHP